MTYLYQGLSDRVPQYGWAVGPYNSVLNPLVVVSKYNNPLHLLDHCALSALGRPKQQHFNCAPLLYMILYQMIVDHLRFLLVHLCLFAEEETHGDYFSESYICK